ncbi:hypothetical protein Bpfe_020605 [Biomphalaria pfeifferi]|uniref:Uncharacterized protein n=1 Tax=Biomphalaria pfeifferi TaxID=112525 RepID=A0AAD8B8R6_BIOPF|nr:hypothetical protein Bpfe_020605 [Biomphalaria pfeifferi]
MLNLIKSLADISVKIEVKDVDDKRKQFSDFPAQASMLDSIDTKIVPGVSYSEVKSASLMKPGNSSTLRDSQMDVNTSDIISSSHLLGSGKVDDVYIRTEADYGPCPCHKKCQEWGEIRVLTSAKLMYDDDDAKNFVCTFFYDDDDDKRMDQLKSARGDRIVLRDLKKDVCMFLCVTCDVELVRTLEEMLNKFEQSWENAFDKYANTVTWESERLTVIVSHPFGLRKHISLGKSLTPNVESSEKRKEYDNPTFNGSSGAFVLIPDFDVSDDV